MPVVNGTTGDDILYASATGDTVFQGLAGNDIVYGGSGNDSLNGDAGDDYLVGSGGNDSLDGGAGSDLGLYLGKRADYTISYNANTAVFTLVDKTAGRDGTDLVTGVESFQFSDGVVTSQQLVSTLPDTTPPTLVSTTPANGAFAVSITSNISITFSEAIVLGAGAIVLKDADGNVVATYSASNTANLSISGNTLTLFRSTPLAASSNYSLELSAGSVKDLSGNNFGGSLGYHFTTAGNGQQLTATAAAPNLTGGTGDDTLIAGPGNGTLDGGAGDDVLVGGAGKTLMLGGTGSDTLISGSGADTMQGGDGGDLYYVNDAGDVVQEQATNAAQPLDPNSPDADLGRAVDKVIASINYTLTGFVENLSLASASGNLAGVGNELNNLLTGNEGNNTLNGKAGNDTLDGGTGLDTAQYSGKFSDYKITLGPAANATALADSLPATVADNRAANLSEGNDSLSNIERLQFSDNRLALDLGITQAGGKTVLMMAVATSLGPALVGVPSLAGIFLNYFDSGASLLDGANLLVATGIVAAFAGGNDNASLVKMVYADVYGKAPDAATLASLLAPLNAGTTSQAQWLADMAASTANQQHVNLVGYAGSGLQYTL